MPLTASGQHAAAPSPANAQLLPTFFIIGPPRTGTTWLHHVLRDRAHLAHPTKETRFFDDHFHRGMDWYGAHYQGRRKDRQVGEVAPTYFASAPARERIARTIPQARVVCTFRHPVDRILSLYRLKRAYAMVPWSFDEAIARDPELMESGKYATHLKAWLSVLGPGQVMSTIYDDLRDQPQAYIDQIADFIGLPRFALSKSQTGYVLTSETLTHPRHYYWTRSAGAMADWMKIRRLDGLVAAAKNLGLLKFFIGGGTAFEDLPAETAASLCRHFRPEIEELEVLLQRDLSDWKVPRTRSRQQRSQARSFSAQKIEAPPHGL